VVLGIDPGTDRTGFAVVDAARDGGRPVAVSYGVIHTRASDPMPERLLSLHRQLERLLDAHPVRRAGVERLFPGRSAPSVITVAQSRGVALLALAQHGVPVAEYTPSAVKNAIVGYGRAEKEQVQAMVAILFGLSERPRPDDAADALAIAYCALTPPPAWTAAGPRPS
jgi:crossover junction endodeoxyribonuclease RuvC